jgi:hypothetical protein
MPCPDVYTFTWLELLAAGPIGLQENSGPPARVSIGNREAGFSVAAVELTRSALIVTDSNDELLLL